MKQKNEILSITALRGIASLLVVFFHFTSGYFDEDSLIRNIFRFGWSGVEIFFVISGFVIIWSMITNSYKINDIASFMIRRVVRIEPPYIISILLVLFLNFISSITPGFQGIYEGVNLKLFAFHLGYLVRIMNEPWLNPVYWSLEIEFHFYIFIALIFPLILNRRLWIKYLALSVILLLSFFENSFTPLFGFLDIFLVGIVTALYISSKIERIPFLTFTIVSLSFILRHHGNVIFMVTTLTLAAIFWGERILKHRYFLFFGNISFSLYLIHVPLGGRLINLSRRFELNSIEKAVVLVASIIFTICAAYLFYRFIEKPFHVWAKRIKYNSVLVKL